MELIRPLVAPLCDRPRAAEARAGVPVSHGRSAGTGRREPWCLAHDFELTSTSTLVLVACAFMTRTPGSPGPDTRDTRGVWRNQESGKDRASIHRDTRHAPTTQHTPQVTRARVATPCHGGRRTAHTDHSVTDTRLLRYPLTRGGSSLHVRGHESRAPSLRPGARRLRSPSSRSPAAVSCSPVASAP